MLVVLLVILSQSNLDYHSIIHYCHLETSRQQTQKFKTDLMLSIVRSTSRYLCQVSPYPKGTYASRSLVMRIQMTSLFFRHLAINHSAHSDAATEIYCDAFIIRRLWPCCCCQSVGPPFASLCVAF